MTAADDPVLAGQLAYYRARAAEYDRTSYGLVHGERGDVGRVAADVPVTGDVLELACGTGVWTRELAPRAASYVAVDGAPEMLDKAMDRCAGLGVQFRTGDVFALDLGSARFDTVFFAFWISHVPPTRFAEFWRTVGEVLRPGGRAVFVDELPSRAANESELAESIATRTLDDGSRHRIVKVFYDPRDLVGQLEQLGWACEVRPTANDWFVATAQRQG